MSVADVYEVQGHRPAFPPARGSATEEREPSGPMVVGDLAPYRGKLITKGIRKRRSVPVMGYIGTSGHGKSGSLVRDTLPSLAMGRPVLSTVEILDAHTGNPHRLYTPFHSFLQLEEFREGDVCMDEITGIMDSHDASMPKYVRRILPQMRRRNVLVRWSGIDWDNSNRRLRQMTQAVTMCRGYLPDRKLLRQTSTADALAMWAPNRVFSLKTYDAQKMMRSEDAQALNKQLQLVGKQRVKVRKPRVLAREMWRGKGSMTFDSYNTLGDVLGVDSGCPICGGRIPEPVCKGH